MKRMVLVALGLALASSATSAQNKAATYITAEQVATVNAQPGTDRTIQVWDLGHEHFSVGIIKRGRTGAPPAGAAGAAAAGRQGGAARGAQPPAQPCGQATPTPPPAGTPTGLYHELQTEGYYITSGSGTMVTGGVILNGRKSAADAPVTTELNGPSCSGSIGGPGVVTREVKQGDIIIIPAGVPHGWSTIADHVEYLSFRPSQSALTPGYVHPSIRK